MIKNKIKKEDPQMNNNWKNEDFNAFLEKCVMTIDEVIEINDDIMNKSSNEACNVIGFNLNKLLRTMWKKIKLMNEEQYLILFKRMLKYVEVVNFEVKWQTDKKDRFEWGRLEMNRGNLLRKIPTLKDFQICFRDLDLEYGPYSWDLTRINYKIEQKFINIIY